MSNYWSGRVHTVIYEDPSQAFYIVKMTLDDQKPGAEPITIKGHVPGLGVAVGTWFGFEGKWTEHPQHGKQISITKAPVVRGGWDPDTAGKMLVSNGVGERVVQRIRMYFGDAEFLAVLGDADRLEEVPGMTKFAAMHVAGRWQAMLAYFKALDFLNDLGLPKSRLRQVWSTFGEDTEKILSTNPWALVQIDGVSFQHADEVAMRLGLDLSKPERLRGAVLHVCKEGRGMGHVFMATGEVAGQAITLIPGTPVKAVAEALAALNKDKSLVIDKTTRPGQIAVYEPRAYEMERDAARLLAERVEVARYKDDERAAYVRALGSFGPKALVASKAGDIAQTVAAAIDDWNDQSKINLTAVQKQGVANALIEPVSVLTGLPGTGKTTSLRAAVRILQDAEVPFLLVAPTGIAAKNLSQRTGVKASTIHRAFAAKGGQEADGQTTAYTGVQAKDDSNVDAFGTDEDWGYDEDNPYPAQVVIIDEASMVDAHLLYRLLTCTAPNCRMVFVGDAAQLPSVGPGNVLRDLINCKQFPVVSLMDIFRQEDTNGIVHAAHAMYRGQMPSFSDDFKLRDVSSEETVLSLILELAKQFYEEAQSQNGASGGTFQILSPRHAGTVGVTNLNARLRELLNPKDVSLTEVKLGEDTIREGDRVMVVKNNYKLGVYNGDVGKVSRIDRKGKVVEVKVFGEPPAYIPFAFSDVPKYLRLAYAVTVHKSQGLEYDRIILPVVGSFRQQLQRNLYYTGITRARKQVVLIGSPLALQQAVVNDKEDRRNTLLPERLTAVFGGGTSSAASE